MSGCDSWKWEKISNDQAIKWTHNSRETLNMNVLSNVFLVFFTASDWRQNQSFKTCGGLVSRKVFLLSTFCLSFCV